MRLTKEKIKALRERLFLKQEDIAIRLGIKLFIYRKIEVGLLELPTECVSRLIELELESQPKTWTSQEFVELRTALGIGSAEMARILKITRACLNKWERSSEIDFREKRDVYNRLEALSQKLLLSKQKVTKEPLKEVFAQNLKELSLSDKDIDLVLKHRSLDFIWKNFTLERGSSFFDFRKKINRIITVFGKYGLTFESYVQAAIKRPNLFYRSPESVIDSITGVVKRFRNSGLSYQKYLVVALKQSTLFAQTPLSIINNIEGVVVRFKDNGLTLALYIQAAIKHPPLFVQSPKTIEKNLIELVAKFHPHLNLTSYIQAAIKKPPLFSKSSETIKKHITNVVEEFKKHGLSLASYVNISLKTPSLFTQNSETIINNIKNVVEHFSDDGLDYKKYIKIACKKPQLFSQSPTTIIKNVTEIVDYFKDYGLTTSLYVKAILKQPTLFSRSPKTIIENILSIVSTYNKYNLTILDYIEAILKQPSLLAESPKTLVEHINHIFTLYQDNIINFNHIKDKQDQENNILMVWLMKKPTTLIFSHENLELRRYYKNILGYDSKITNLSENRINIEETLVKFFDESGEIYISKITRCEPSEPGFETYAKNWALRGLIRAGIVKTRWLK